MEPMKWFGHIEWDTITKKTHSYISQFDYELSQLVVAWFDPSRTIFKSSPDNFTSLVNEGPKILGHCSIMELFSMKLCEELIIQNDLPVSVDNYNKVYDWYESSIWRTTASYYCENAGYNLVEKQIKSTLINVDAILFKQFTILRKTIYKSAMDEYVMRLVAGYDRYELMEEYFKDTREAGYFIPNHPHWDGVESFITTDIFGIVDCNIQHLYQDYYEKNNPDILTYIATMIANNEGVNDEYEDGVVVDAQIVVERYLELIK